MSRTSFIAIVSALSLLGCHTSELDSNNQPDSGGSQPEPSSKPLPDHPDEFRIELSGGPCFGPCPTYDVTLDQAGNVSVFAEACAARPGVFRQKVPTDDARAVYDALLSSPYPTLNDRYVEEEDGCEVVTDAPTFVWNVSADGQEKPLVRYSGCEGVDGLEEVDALMSLLQERSDTRRFVERNDWYCDESLPPNIEDLSLRLSHAGSAIAMLKVAKQGSAWTGRFVLEDCAGGELARGQPVLESRRWLLIDERRQPITLPGELADVGSVVLTRQPVDENVYNGPLKTTAVRAFLVDGEIDLSFEAAESCTN